ncbi:folate family ECF transporter S component [Lentilactobacillus sp. IMAU92037]|uniref:folate family ECF transporter S component n=1 Tax=Lentilactobacillus TaxID=2767893 RepID=UPI001C25CFDE|nr:MULTISPECIES: folate family ECF transporter S component [Lentilactobacillus]MBU9788999.1 folate family ECF transporter S component [Lentilactobacillus dabitei]MBV0929767.1 folate family ECF transporter S component [Lentilactobacillus dabitei]MDM7517500.1 folate family ECF transporter S component [Lentilactobacillus sp. TOM.63]
MKSLSLGFRKLRTLDVVVLGVLMALALILGRFTVGTQFMRLSFGFIVVAITSYLYGPLWSSTTAALGDIIGTLISGSPYFPGFTVSAILGAAIYGFFFYNKEITWKRVIVSQLIIAVLVNAVLNTFWLTVLYKTPFFGLLPMRTLKEVIITPIQIAILYFIMNSKSFEMIKNRLLN